VLPAATVTVAGTVRSALLLLSVTVAGAPRLLVRVTVHVDEADDPRLDGEHESRLTTLRAIREMDADCEPLFKTAVSDAV